MISQAQSDWSLERRHHALIVIIIIIIISIINFFFLYIYHVDSTVHALNVSTSKVQDRRWPATFLIPNPD